MGNIVDYVKEKGNEDFSLKSFCTEDALILCEFSYLKFDYVMPEMAETPVSLQEIKKHEKFETLFVDYRYEKDHRALFDAMIKSERFKDIKACFHVNRIDSDLESQFCAITFILPGGLTFVAFRGTDETIIGWQEDCRMSLLKPIKGQTLSAKYINDVSSRVSGNVMVGGHSKGGNLAVYSAMNCSKEIQDRISVVYSFDGPGFRQEVLEKYGYDRIKERIVSVIPKSSIIGLLLATDENSIVVNAKSIGMHQHNPYNWIIEDGALVRAKLTDQHLLMINTYNEWVAGLDDVHLEGYVNMLIEILNATQADTTLEISADTYKYVSNVIKAHKELDDESKDFLSGLLKSFFELMKEKMKNEVSLKFEEKKGEVTLKLEETREEMEKRIKKKNKYKRPVKGE